MEKNEILKIILDEKLVVVVRLKQQADVPQVLKALVEGGVKVLEITSNTPGFLEEIAKARKLYQNVLIGAGTVTNSTLAKDSIDAGAQFLVSPNTNPEIVATAHAHRIPVLMGALTPTEIGVAENAGADIVKLFPSGNLGIAYFKAVSSPFSSVKFFAVGGINLDNAIEWLNAGVSGVGLGGSLVRPIHSEKEYEENVEIAKQLVELIKK